MTKSQKSIPKYGHGPPFVLFTNKKSLFFTRWLSNSISGYLNIVTGPNTPLHVRLAAIFELVHTHTCVSRAVACCVLFMHALHQQHVMYLCVLPPLVLTFARACLWGRYALFLLTGCVVSYVVGPVLNACVFVNCVLNFTSVSWGVSHGGKMGQKNK